ncbi:MAG: hypothetical protein O2946_02450 [Planctomycetota bacterium]|nr:hypothetical protein [Planctomycetota bacterium]MDA0970580.1 hypothetical protein [Planctomycetota bacterium]
MVRYTLDSETCQRLGEVDQTVELCDGDGKVIGYFLPERGPRGLPPAGLKPTLTAEELEQRRRSRSGRTLDEILGSLGQR